MPSRHVLREYATSQYYHVYNRGVAKQAIFADNRDKQKFLAIIQRHLDPSDESTRADGVPYPKFDRDIELLCYCLMGNHFHFLLFTTGSGESLAEFMKSILTAYTMYFNKRHKRVGSLFQGVFKASRITKAGYLTHITRYIHLNPRTYKTYEYSSLHYYLGEPAPAWCKPERILDMFIGVDYLQFLEDYAARHAMLEVLYHELADK